MPSDIHWHLLLRFGKGSIDLDVCRGCALGPCCCLSAGCLPSAGIHPAGKVRPTNDLHTIKYSSQILLNGAVEILKQTEQGNNRTIGLERYQKSYPIPNIIGSCRYQYPIPIPISVLGITAKKVSYSTQYYAILQSMGNTKYSNTSTIRTLQNNQVQSNIKKTTQWHKIITY